MFNFLRKLPDCFPKWLQYFIFPTTVHEGSNFSTSSPTLMSCHFDYSPDVKSWLIRKDPDAGKDWRQEKGMTEDKMVGWHHWHNGHEFEQALGDCDGWTGKPGMLQSMGSQRVGHNWVTEQQSSWVLNSILWFWLTFPYWWCCTSFHVLTDHVYIISGELLNQIFCSF